MTKEQFNQYIQQKLQAVKESLKDPDKLPGAEVHNLREQEAMLIQAQKMARYSSGGEYRRFRRNYERLLYKYRNNSNRLAKPTS